MFNTNVWNPNFISLSKGQSGGGRFAASRSTLCKASSPDCLAAKPSDANILGSMSACGIWFASTLAEVWSNLPYERHSMTWVIFFSAMPETSTENKQGIFNHTYSLLAHLHHSGSQDSQSREMYACRTHPAPHPSRVVVPVEFASGNHSQNSEGTESHQSLKA